MYKYESCQIEFCLLEQDEKDCSFYPHYDDETDR